MIPLRTAKWLPALALVMITASPTARANLIFSDPNYNELANLPAGSSPVSHITVSAPTVINQIAVLVDLAAAGNIKFLIYNFQSSSFEFISTAQLFGNTGLDFKLSEVFGDITLLPGVDYFIGGISDTAGSWAFLSPPSPVTGGDVTNHDFNGNVTNFADPSFLGMSSSQVPIQLYGPGSAPAVPEPATWATGLIGALLCSGYVARRRRAA